MSSVPASPSSSRTEPASLEAGARVVGGKFKLVKPLAAGGMGSVWIAEQQPLGRNVAFKVLKKPSDAAEARFFREMQALARISHAHVVTVYDSGRTEDGALYLAMELVDGPTLREELEARGRVSEAAALELVKQIASGLAAAHEQKIAHLDLKPENIVLHRTSHGREVKILDFGIARILEDPAASSSQKTETAAGVTEEGVAVGTPGYMSPEQLLGVRDDVRSDLYALGVIWFELLTGRAPFTGATTAEIAAKTLTQTPPPPSAIQEGCASEATEALLSRLFARDPNARPKDGGALARELDGLASPTSSNERARDVPPRVSATASTKVRAIEAPAPSARRSIGVTVGFGAVVAIAVTGMFLARDVYRPPAGPMRVAVLGFEQEKGDPVEAKIVADTLAHSLAAMKNLRVVSPLVVAHALKEKNGDALAAANALGVELAITGTVRDVPPLDVTADLHDLRIGDAGEPTKASGASAADVVQQLVPQLEDRVAVAMGPKSEHSDGDSVARKAVALKDVAPSSPPPKTAVGIDASENRPVKQRLSGSANEGGPGAAPAPSPMPAAVMMATTNRDAYAEFLEGEGNFSHDLKTAEEHLVSAVEKDPSSQTAWVHVAIVRAIRDQAFTSPRVKDALLHVGAPQSLPPYEEHVFSVVKPLSDGDAKTALAAAQAWKQLDDGDPVMWALLGHAWDASKDLAQAINCMQKAVERAPDVGAMQVSLAEMRIRKGDRDDALRSLKKYVSTHPNDVDASFALGAFSAPP